MQARQRHGGYELLELVGKGAFGEVYRGRHISRDLVVAVKVINFEEHSDEIDDIQKECRYMRECQHPNIARIFHSFNVGPRLWIVMEFLGGGSVAEIVRLLGSTGKRMADQQIAVVAREMLQGLFYLHEDNKIHRDIKGANVVLSTTCHVKITDLGVSAQLAHSRRGERGLRSVVGTPNWMAPEVVNESRYNEKCDVWSLGVTVYEMAVGRPPYSQNADQALLEIVRDPPPRLPAGDFSANLRGFVALCLNKQPEERPGVAEASRHALISEVDDTPTSCLQPLVSLWQRRSEHLAERRADTGRSLGSWDDSETTQWDFPETRHSVESKPSLPPEEHSNQQTAPQGRPGRAPQVPTLSGIAALQRHADPVLRSPSQRELAARGPRRHVRELSAGGSQDIRRRPARTPPVQPAPESRRTGGRSSELPRAVSAPDHRAGKGRDAGMRGPSVPKLTLGGLGASRGPPRSQPSDTPRRGGTPRKGSQGHFDTPRRATPRGTTPLGTPRGGQATLSQAVHQSVLRPALRSLIKGQGSKGRRDRGPAWQEDAERILEAADGCQASCEAFALHFVQNLVRHLYSSPYAGMLPHKHREQPGTPRSLARTPSSSVSSDGRGTSEPSNARTRRQSVDITGTPTSPPPPLLQTQSVLPLPAAMLYDHWRMRHGGVEGSGGAPGRQD